MKVKWTTITEDESTWPPLSRNGFLITYNGASGDKIVSQADIGIDKKIVLLNQMLRDYDDIDKYIGQQWRPMPKPPKKQIKKQSPWKSTNIKPNIGSYFIVRGNGKVSGLYCYEMIGYNNIPGLTDSGLRSWEEWMEIPE